MKKLLSAILMICVMISCISCAHAVENAYAVSTDNDYATQVGMDILAAGGNAVDAAIAVSFALGVAEPYASGLGGSGVAVIYNTETGVGKVYDYRATAGSVVHENASVGVPGTVAGMDALFHDYATMEWADLIAPAIGLAENGVKINATFYDRMSSYRAATEYDWFHKKNGALLGEGDTIVQEEQAKTLRDIAEQGADVFYHGYIAEDIANACHLTAEEIANYKVEIREPVTGTFNGKKVIAAGEPFGGVTLIQLLEMADMIDLADGREDTATYLTQLKQITTAAYANRSKHAIDPAWKQAKRKESGYVKPEYVADLLGTDYGDLVIYEDDNDSPDTTGFTIVDKKNHLVVAVTNTLTSFWGCKRAVDGFHLNNTNSNFPSKGKGAAELGKRPISLSAPVILAGDDGYVMALATPGGNNIPRILLQVVCDICRNGMEPQEALDKMRVIYRSGVMFLEKGEKDQRWVDLSKVKTDVLWRTTGLWWGSVSLTGLTADGEAFGAFDTRRSATAAGVYNGD